MSDITDRLRSAIPAEIVDHVVKEIAAACARRLPVGTLEHLALELAAKGTGASDIVRELTAQHRALWLGREAMRAGGRASPDDNEIEAAGTALRKGADDVAISALAAATPENRSLAVPLTVIANLMDRGLPSDDVVAAMHVWLESGATDRELKDLAGPPERPALTVIRTRPNAPHAQRPLNTDLPRRPSDR